MRSCRWGEIRTPSEAVSAATVLALWAGEHCQASSEPRVFTVVRRRELGRHSFLAPELAARAPRVALKVYVTFAEVSVDSPLGFVNRFVVAVVNDGTSHAAEHRLNQIEELRACWERLLPGRSERLCGKRSRGDEAVRRIALGRTGVAQRRLNDEMAIQCGARTSLATAGREPAKEGHAPATVALDPSATLRTPPGCSAMLAFCPSLSCPGAYCRARLSDWIGPGRRARLTPAVGLARSRSSSGWALPSWVQVGFAGGAGQAQ